MFKVSKDKSDAVCIVCGNACEGLFHQGKNHGHKVLIGNNNTFSSMRSVNIVGFLLAYRVNGSVNSSSGTDMPYWAA